MSLGFIRTNGSSRPRILVTARAGDPLMLEGRARLIWAANTADALSELGYEAWLTGKKDRHHACAQDTKSRGELVPHLTFRRFYGTGKGFRIIPSTFPRLFRAVEEALSQGGRWEANFFIPRLILPRAQAVHTRDFRIAAQAVRRGIPTMYEDHHESFHRSIEAYPAATVNHPAFRLAIAPTAAVRDGMIARGMPKEKTVVAWSGLNQGSLRQVDSRRVQEIRQRYLANGTKALVSYCGGLHKCRGIDFILRLASRHTDTAFVILGGRPEHAKALRQRCQEQRLTNVSVIGYRPQVEVPVYLQASDAALMPYTDRDEAKVTSPMKFFEYIASGIPLIATRLPELKAFYSRHDMTIDWCEVSDYAGFEDAFHHRMKNAAYDPSRNPRHIEQAARYTWHRRQEFILRRAGLAWCAERSPAREHAHDPAEAFSGAPEPIAAS